MLCPSCGHNNPADATDCTACATPLPANIQTGGTEMPAGETPVYAPHLPKNTRLQNGNYAIGEVLGQGGFGITYKGGDMALKRYVAIKEFFPQGCAREGASVRSAGHLSEADFARVKAKFAEEARTLARFSDPGIVRVFGVFEENNTAYMVMEFLEGSTLSKRMNEAGRLGEAEAIDIAEKIGGALSVVHQAGLIHRDLKPDNICLTKDGRVVLIDFGTARAFASGKTVRQTTMLTPGYAPLEQYGQQARFGAYTDIYALAATLYHAVTGQVPPQATDRASGVALRDPRALNPKLSPTFSKALVWAMSIKAADRPQTVSAFVTALSTKLQPSLTPLDDVTVYAPAPVVPTPVVPAAATGGWGGAPPPDEKWYHAVGGQQTGPVTRADLHNLVRNGAIGGETLVWKEGTPDWIMARDSEWSGQLTTPAPPRIPHADNTDYLQTQYTGFDRFMMSIPAWVWRTMWAAILLFITSGIWTGWSRYTNGDRDFGPELAREVLRVDKGPLRSAKLQLGEGVFDPETLTKRHDNYEGRVRYDNGDAGDLALEVKSRDWLQRPDKFDYAYEPTNFGPLIASEIKPELEQSLRAKGQSFSKLEIILQRDSRNIYTGSYLMISGGADDDRMILGGGEVNVAVTRFNDADGAPAEWTYTVSSG